MGRRTTLLRGDKKLLLKVPYENIKKGFNLWATNESGKKNHIDLWKGLKENIKF